MRRYAGRPICFGYRAVHLIIRDELPIEVQVRTKLQHSWAEMIEDMSTRHRDETSLPASTSREGRARVKSLHTAWGESANAATRKMGTYLAAQYARIKGGADTTKLSSPSLT
ncbi:MAG: hypothetical protein ACLPYS_15430, partial [Vulcanimicrobiaceae bacterium]